VAERKTEIGIVMEASPGYTARLAADIEAMGFEYLLCPDTQNLAPDPSGNYRWRQQRPEICIWALVSLTR